MGKNVWKKKYPGVNKLPTRAPDVVWNASDEDWEDEYRPLHSRCDQMRFLSKRWVLSRGEASKGHLRGF